MINRDVGIFGALVVGLLFFALDANAFRKPDKAPLPDMDVRQKAGTNLPPTERKASLAHMQSLQPGVKTSFDPLIGSPRLVASAESFLSGRNGSGRGISPEVAARFANDPNGSTKAFLEEHHGLFGHGSEVLPQARIKRDYVSAHNGLRTTAWEQQVGGIGVFEGLLVSHTTRNGELVNISSRFLPKTFEAVAAGTPRSAAVPRKSALSAAEALVIAAQDVGENLALSQVSSVAGQAGDAERHETFRAPALKGDAYANLTWLPISAKSFRLSWKLIFESQSRHEMFLTLVDAQTGKTLLRRTLTRHASPATFRVFTGESPTPLSPGFSSPNTSQPPQVSRELITLVALDTNASPAGWIDEGINELHGNNVNAYLDRDSSDSPDLPLTQGSPNRVFDFPLDLKLSPRAYGDASVAQLFYVCNWYHDKLYQLGFTEASGNFQNDNFGRGGLAGDAVNAEAQDGSSINNSDFSPAPDGQPPRMQMYLFNGPSPRRDGTFDTEIVLHEYTHGLTDRMVGGGMGLTTVQSLALSEGWSDFYALALLTGSGDDVDGSYPMAPYASYLLDGETQNYYYGIRRYPYSTDMAKNPLTFKDIDPAQAISHYGAPMSPAFVFKATDAIEVHNAGEVWCATLWEVRAGLIKKYGWATGNQLVLQLVTDGLRLSPPNPSFVEARDAIIQADRVNNAGANYRALWAAFAKRGLGFHAYSPASADTAGIVESFADADDLAITTDGETSSGPVGGPFTVLSHEWLLSDSGVNPVPWSVGTASSWITLSQTSGTLISNQPPVSVSAHLNLAALNLTAGIYTNFIRFTNQASGVTQSRQFVLYVGQPDYFAESFDTTTNDLAWQSFTFTPDTSLSAYNVCRTDITDFPTDLTGGVSVSMTYDNYATVTLTGSHKAVLYGTASSAFYIGSNGYITFGSGDSSNDQTFGNLFKFARIAPFLDDLDPGTNGVVSWKELCDRVAVTWSNVPEYGLGNTNSFQVELFYDGRIRLSYLRMDVIHGIVGLSRGVGIPRNFTPSDFLGYRRCCAPNAWLSVALPTSVVEGVGSLVGQGAVMLSKPLAYNLAVALASSDPASITVPVWVVVPAGLTNAAFDLTVPDNTVINGLRTVTITPTATGLAAMPGIMQVSDSKTPVLTVRLPSISIAGSVAQGQVGISPTPSFNVGVKLSMSGSGSVGAQIPSWIAIPAGQTSAVFNVQTGNTPFSNSRSLIVTAHVDQWADASAAMTLLYSQSTNLTVSVPSNPIAGNGTLTNYGWLALSNALVSSLTVPLFSSSANVTVPANVTIPAGRKGVAFNITIADHIDGSQTAVISEGLTGSSSSISLLDDQTPLPPSVVTPVDGSATNSCVVSLTWCSGLGEGRELIVNGNFETGDLTGWTLANTNGSFVIEDATVSPASGDNPPPPYAGGYSVLGQRSGSGVFQMSQDIALPAKASVIALGWTDRQRNFAGFTNISQQFRVELRTTNNVSLCAVFASTNGIFSDWTTRIYDISSFRGQTLRLCFIITAAMAPLDVYIDNITVRAANPSATLYDVYLGTNATLDAAQFLGTTTNTTWPAVTLPVGAEYWQVVARRTGSAVSPVWRFSTVPTVFLSNTEVLEGAAGTTTNAVFSASLSGPSAQTISLAYATSDGTATAATDYVAVVNGTLVFMPGEVSKTISVAVNGDDIPEQDETFWLNITSATNAPLATNRAMCVIRNDDPWPGVVDRFVWSQIPSPQEVGEPFRVNIAAYDIFDNPVTNLTTLFLSGIALGQETNILGNRTPSGSDHFSTYTLGLAFTPDTNITVTHARHYGGAKVSIWTESQTLIASVSVQSVAGQWVETPFSSPVRLTAGTRYRVGVYTAGQTYSWVSDSWPRAFADGTIHQPCYSSTDSFPTNSASRGLYLVDLGYSVGWPAQIAVTPAVVTNVADAAWTGTVTVPMLATNFELVADDGAGHQTCSNPFDTVIVGPRLLSAGMSSSGFVISWPAPIGTYVLESTDSLDPMNWQPVAEAPVQVGNTLLVTNPPTNGERYFRLRK